MNLLGWFHVGTAVLALLSGALVLLSRKGTRRHRRTGWVYVGSMVALNGSALLIYRLFGGFGPFHLAALFSLLTIFVGILPAFTPQGIASGSVERHYYWMCYSYAGLWAAALAEAVTRLPGSRFWWAVLAATGAVLALAATLITSRASATLAPFRSPRPGA